jgi:hypothetical protein
MKTCRASSFSLILCFIGFHHLGFCQVRQSDHGAISEELLLNAMHSISSHPLMEYVTELASAKYQGRLTGTAAFNEAAGWSAGLFKQWNIKPLGENGTYFQEFPNPYTLVLESGEVTLRIPMEKNDTLKKSYRFEEDFFPGSTSDAGTVTAEVFYVGYGITAPELEYDDYRGMNVRGKIVMFEPEVPVSPDRQPEIFKQWRPYSFHDYKMKNAFAHGAAGVLYNYHIVNPNCVFIKGLVISYVGASVTADIFAGTGKVRDSLVQTIRRTHKPLSFGTGKIVTVRCATEHHPEGVGRNIIGWIEGSDPTLRHEVVILGAHLDHVGMNHLLMPGANDNASGVAVLLGTAEALSKVSGSLKRSVLFILFGAEEQGVKGSEYYVSHPVVPNANVKAFINLESIGRGEKISVGAGENYPQLWSVLDRMNAKYIHRTMTKYYNANLARPRQDAAHFLWANIPTLGMGAYDAKPLPVATYHTTQDKIEHITPEILEDIGRLMFLSIVDMAR